MHRIGTRTDTSTNTRGRVGRMIATAVVGLCAISTAASALPPPVVSPRNAPERLDPNATITFANTEHDFGQIWDTDPVTTRFAFTNTGSSALTIFSARGSCGCTAPNVFKNGEALNFPVTFQPGESGELTVRFDPTGRRGEQPKTVTLRTNDAANPQLTLNLTSTVRQIVISDPGVVSYGPVEKHAGASQEMTVWGVLDGFAIVDTEADSELISIEVVETGRAEHPDLGVEMGFSRLRFDLNREVSIGRFNSMATLMTNDDRRDSVVVRIVADVRGDLFATPNRVPLGRLTTGQAVESTFRVKSRAGLPFRVTDFRVSGRFSLADAGVTVTPVRPIRQPGEPEIPADAPAVEYIVVLKGNAPEGQRLVRADIILSTDVSDEAEVKIPFFGSVRPAPVGG